MDFSPEAQILILNAAILGVAYLGILPSLTDKSIGTLMRVDLTLSGIALTTAGALFWGSATRFDLILFQTNWSVFTLITFMIMEAPLFAWFAKRYGIRLDDSDDDDPD